MISFPDEASGITLGVGVPVPPLAACGTDSSRRNMTTATNADDADKELFMRKPRFGWEQLIGWLFKSLIVCETEFETGVNFISPVRAPFA